MLSFDKIDTFKNLQLKQNSLLVLDIDETILTYSGICNQWWKDHFNKYYTKHNDYDRAEKESNADWKEYISTRYPLHTDKEGFFDLMERAKSLNCKTIFVTARDADLEQLTHKHLQYLGIDLVVSLADVYFTSGNNKGITIEKVIANNTYNEIIFVDDKSFNLKDVKEYFKDMVVCYKFDGSD